ncbi:hypothetical protein [Amycolatopsis rubida]|nr:hypothetical protein [Amycolatopsis rubida]
MRAAAWLNATQRELLLGSARALLGSTRLGAEVVKTTRSVTVFGAANRTR